MREITGKSRVFYRFPESRDKCQLWAVVGEKSFLEDRRKSWGKIERLAIKVLSAELLLCPGTPRMPWLELPMGSRSTDNNMLPHQNAGNNGSHHSWIFSKPYTYEISCLILTYMCVWSMFVGMWYLYKWYVCN